MTEFSDEIRPDGAIDPKDILPEHPKPLQNVTVCGDSYPTHVLNDLRNEQTPPPRFRKGTRDLGAYLAKEALRGQKTLRSEIVTPVAVTLSGMIPLHDFVLVSIRPDGDFLAQGVWDVLPDVAMGEILIPRPKDGDKAGVIFKRLPDLTGRIVILCDSILQTGRVAHEALAEIVPLAREVRFLTLLAMRPGLELIGKKFPDVHVWTIAIDPRLAPNGEPWPGLGNIRKRTYSATPRR